MKTNIEIVDGEFKTTLDVKTGVILLHPDWPLGIAARDIAAGEIIKYSSYKDTKDVILKTTEWKERMKFCAVEDIKAGQDMNWYGIVPIGVAARDIPTGSAIDYKPDENTADVIVI